MSELITSHANNNYSNDDFSAAIDTANKLKTALGKVIRGREDTINLVLTGLFADGHVLLEDYPGSGKTLLTKTLGKLIGTDSKTSSTQEHILPFRRIQFTPDMLPGDILGVNIFEPKTGSFKFLHGPVFAHIVLADELNRTGPKVQAAFLECMAEKQVTIDNVTYPLDKFFFVIGTQNPLDLAGTYPLPLVQLDRFLLRIPMSYVDSKTEEEILQSHGDIMQNSEEMRAICTRSDILSAQSAVEKVIVSEPIRKTIVSIVQATRDSALFQFGVSTRAAIMLQKALKSFALLSGRNYVEEDDLTAIAPHVLQHRIRFQGGVRDPRESFKEFLSPHIEKLVKMR